MIKPQSIFLGLYIAVTAYLLWVPQTFAQAVLIEASPAPDSILLASPTSIDLTFDRVASVQDTYIEVRSEDGAFSVSNSVVSTSSNRLKVSMELPPLVDGVYQVHYVVKAIGGSTLAVGSYTFTIDPPDPKLELVSPVNGSAFALGEPIRLEMRTQSFEFGFFSNRIRIYVDGKLYDEIQANSYEINDLAPGVHEIRTVLVKLESSEFSETENVVIVAVMQDDPETEGRIEAASADSDPGLNLNAIQLAGIGLLTAVLMGIGISLGRSSVR